MEDIEVQKQSPVHQQMPNDATTHPRLNGENSLPKHIFTSDNEDSSSSSGSSSTSHSLVIDQIKTSVLSNKESLASNEDKRVLKRKLSENSEGPPDSKRLNLSDNNCPDTSSEKELDASNDEESLLENKSVKSLKNNNSSDDSSSESSGSDMEEDTSNEIDQKEHNDIDDKLDTIDNSLKDENNSENNLNLQKTQDDEEKLSELSEKQETSEDKKDVNLEDSTETDSHPPDNSPVQNDCDNRPIQEYAGYLGLKPAEKYQCCDKNFDTLLEFNEHKTSCSLNNKEESPDLAVSENKLEEIKENKIEEDVSTVQNEALPCNENSESEKQDTTSLDETSTKEKEVSNENLNNEELKIPATATATATATSKKKVFLCSVCKTYFAEWNLFLHMREIHNRHICLYCLGMFPTADRLTMHLEMKHDMEQIHFESHSKFLRSSRDACYLMCCTCEHLFTEQENFDDHVCSDFIKPCDLCGEKGHHNSGCKAARSRSAKHKDRSKRKSKLANNKSINETRSMSNIEKRSVVTKSNLSGGFSENKEALKEPYLNGMHKQDYNENSNKILQDKPTDIELNPGTSSASSRTDVRSINHKNKINDIESNGGESLITNSTVANSQFIEDQTTAISKISTETREFSPRERKYLDENGSKEATEANEPLLVPKLKVKVPKKYLTPIESEQSSSESDSDKEQVDHMDEDSEENAGNEHNYKVTNDESGERNVNENEVKINGQKTESVLNEDNHKLEMEKSQIDDSILSSNMSLLQERLLSGSPHNSQNGDHISNSVLMKKSEEKIPSESQEQDQVMRDMIEENPFESDMNRVSPKQNIKSMDDPMNNDVTTCNKSGDDESIYQPPMDIEEPNHIPEEIKPSLPEDGIPVANEDVQLIDLLLKSPLDKIEMVDFLRICLRSAYPFCLYCNHARHIAVNSNSFILHLVEMHRFSATVDSITAEELQPATILGKLKAFLLVDDIYFNLESYSSTNKENFVPYERVFECFRCRFVTKIHKELYLHNRKMHLKNAVFCIMCKTSFYSYSELICHMCPGKPNKCTIFDISFRCCLCNTDNLQSPFRLMVHLRKKHSACDVCLENCFDQSRLSSHVWKHKLHHLCYRCGISYRNKPDITKHLFWKHGTESVSCKRCLQKRWPHVYHFCIQPSFFVCEVCNLTFSKAMALKIHKRLHSGDAPYPCTEDNCEKKFISRKLLLKHVARHNGVTEEKPMEEPAKPCEDQIVDEVKKEEDVADVKSEKPEEQVKEEASKDENSTETTKQKRKKAKKDSKENLDDIMDLPAPNLSESDSSDDSECDKPKSESFSSHVPNVMLSPASDNGNESDEADTGRIMDIWENFKTFQASQPKNVEEFEDTQAVPPPPILHVAQSDHDYCMMFKPISKAMNATSNDDEKLDDFQESKVELPCKEEIKKKSRDTPKKKQKSRRKSGSDSSSSSSSSGSDSSCSCGSNCSCSSSSGNSSGSSSSSEDSDSSTSEGRRRIAERRKVKEEKKKQEKQNESLEKNTSEIDVVTADMKPEEVDPDNVILESDLETDETETDEDFYDEHPQKLANELWIEKRKQLMMQTSLSPSHNFDIVENSRPSTPSLPEEMVKEKKVKLKKKKKERKSTKNNSVFNLKLNIPIDPPVKIDETILPSSIQQSLLPTPPVLTPIPFQPEHAFASAMSSPIIMQRPPLISEPVHNELPPPLTPSPAPISQKARLSTGSGGSDADLPLKRSKRRRRPNKFYGYSSDDEGAPSHPLVTGPAAFKPTPPPNLTWDKEDLPSPSKSTVKIKSSVPKKSTTPMTTPISTPPLPPIPPIIIRPTSTLPSDIITQRPPVVEPLRVPPVPVHYIQPPSVANSRDSNESDSSEEGKLQITATSRRKKSTTNTTPRAQTQKQQKQAQLKQQQQQQRQIQQQQQVQQTIAQPQSKPYQPPPIPPALLVQKTNPSLELLQYFQRNHIRYPIQPPAGARPAREGESVYCYCRCPYDEVSEMIACDGENCAIEWFHFECVGIMVPPRGKWFCPECKPKYPNEVSDYDNT